MTDKQKKDDTIAKKIVEHKEEQKEKIAKSESESEAVVKKESKEAMKEVSEEGKKIIEKIEKMTVLELHKLVKAIEEKFDVSAAAVAVASPEGEGGEEESDSLIVELKDVGEQKIAVIKAVKEILGLGLKDAKDLVDGAPSVLKEGIKKEEAQEIKTKIEEAGGKVELK